MIWSKQEAYILDDCADNEIISNDGFIYERRTKPNNEDLRQLRYIKQVRKEQQRTEPIKPSHPLAEDLKGIVELRKERRKELLNSISENLIKLYSERGTKVITSEDINDLVSCIKSKDTRARIRADLLKLLVNSGKVTKDKYNKTYYQYQRKPMLTYDSESYNTIKNKRFVECGSNVSIARQPLKMSVIVYKIN